MRAMLKKNITTYISLEVNECRFREKYELPGSSIRQKKTQITAKMTMCPSIELIRDTSNPSTLEK